jgi:hypothetical protein
MTRFPYAVLLVATAISFHFLIAGILVTQKHGKLRLFRLCSAAWFALIVPLGALFAVALLRGAGVKTVIRYSFVFLYMGVEFLLDILLKVEFRSRWATHVPYILLEYAALFSLLGLARDISRLAGFLVLGGLVAVMMAVAYVLMPRRSCS